MQARGSINWLDTAAQQGRVLDGADHRSYVKEGDVRCDTGGVEPVSWKELPQCLIGGLETSENLDMQYLRVWSSIVDLVGEPDDRS